MNERRVSEARGRVKIKSALVLFSKSDILWVLMHPLYNISAGRLVLYWLLTLFLSYLSFLMGIRFPTDAPLLTFVFPLIFLMGILGYTVVWHKHYKDNLKQINLDVEDKE